MTATLTRDNEYAGWDELLADLAAPRPRRRRRVVVVVAAAVVAAFAAGYVAAPDRQPAPAPVIVVCQESDPAACVEMPAVR